LVAELFSQEIKAARKRAATGAARGGKKGRGSVGAIVVVDSGDQLGHGVNGSDRLVMTEAVGAHGQADDADPVATASNVQSW
jgi:hypothetical protein